MAGVSMSKNMKIHRRWYLCGRACLNKRSLLVRLAPGLPIVANKNVLIRGTPRRPGNEQRSAFAGQDNVARLTAFGLVNDQGIAVRVEICTPQISKLGIPAARQ